MTLFERDDVIVIVYGTINFHALIDRVYSDSVSMILYNPAEAYINYRTIIRRIEELRFIYLAHVCGPDKLRIQRALR
jgi:hypothetical protein